jgi:hypothetical protein
MTRGTVTTAGKAANSSFASRLRFEARLWR